MTDPYEEPAMVTPPGVISQFPTTRSDVQAWYYVSATLSAIVPGSLLLVRIYTKLRIMRKVDIVDYFHLLSFVIYLESQKFSQTSNTAKQLSLIALIICGRLCLAEGAGVYQWNLPLRNLIRVNYWFYIAQIVYAPTVSLVKATILLQYLRLFAPQKVIDPLMWYSARILITVITVYYTISTFLTIFACSPREALWNPLITDYRCLDNNTSAIITCIFNLISDTTILMLPARAVWKLRIPIRKKIRIMLLFTIGLLACIATAMAIVYLERMGGYNADISYNTLWVGVWLFAEIALGITVTGALLLPKFLEAKGAKLRGVFSGFKQNITVLISGASFGKGTIADQEVSLDTITIVGHSESDVGSTNSDQDVERYPSYEGTNITATYSRSDAVVDPSRVQGL